jgi:peptidoglycan/LPS O-acetylase OafA/YrhL
METASASGIADSTASRPRNPRFALFDGLRGMAVLAVLATHIAGSSGAGRFAWYGFLTSHLFVGVHLFFLISGFLLYRPYAVEILGGPKAQGLRTYARRRLLRIGPAYWVALTLLALWPGLSGVWSSVGWIYYLFGQGYFPLLLFGGIPAGWSLTVEVGFYCALPAIAWGMRRLCRDQPPDVAERRQIFGFLTLGAAGEIFRYVAAPSFVTIGATLGGTILDFSVAMSLAVLSARIGRDEKSRPWAEWIASHPGTCWTLGVGLYIAASASPILPRSIVDHTRETAALSHITLVCVAFLMMLPAVFGEGRGGIPRRILGHPFLQWIGLVAYGVYLWHQPLLHWMASMGWERWIPFWPALSLALLIVPVSLLCGAASFYLVERPLMRYR